MFSRTLLVAVLCVSSAIAQTATPAGSANSAAKATGAGGNAQADADNLLHYLLPSAPSTSLSPAQESKIAVDASKFLDGYTQTRPISAIAAQAFIGQLFGGASTTPSPAQESSIGDLLNMAGTAAVANPSAYVQSVGDIVRPFAFAGAVTSYADGLFDGLRTVVASDLGLPVPTPASKSSAGAACRAVPTGVIGVAAAAAAGVAGVVLL